MRTRILVYIRRQGGKARKAVGSFRVAPISSCYVDDGRSRIGSITQSFMAHRNRTESGSECALDRVLPNTRSGTPDMHLCVADQLCERGLRPGGSAICSLFQISGRGEWDHSRSHLRDAETRTEFGSLPDGVADRRRTRLNSSAGRTRRARGTP